MNTIARPTLPATIGDTNNFAVIVDLDEQFGGEWLFGRVGYVIAGTSVGDYELGTSLRDVLLQMHLILSDAGKRRAERFIGLPKDELFNLVWNVLYGDKTTGMEDIAIDECWAKHNITLPVDVFDHVRVFQFDEGSTSRILWRPVSDGECVTREHSVPIGYTERVFEELSGLLNQITIWENSMK
jgi:hypothetical protein